MSRCEISGSEPGQTGGLSRGHWEHFPHEADVGIRGVGPTKSDAFVQAARALTAVIADLETIQSVQTVIITCRAPNDELLLVDWLNALVYEMATRKMLFNSFAVEMDSGGLHGSARGEPVDVARHQPVVEVKGATLAELRVGRDADSQWFAQCIVDV